MVRGLQEFGCDVDIYDPWADPEEVRENYGLTAFNRADRIRDCYDAVVLVVAHREFLDFDVRNVSREGAVVFDVKGVLPRQDVTARL